MPPIEMTVLFATRNGEHVLPRTLGAYRDVTPPPVRWKLVVVDNGSADATPAILDAFRRYLPLDVLQQSIPGKNRALNTGIDAIEGHLVIITDDDAVPTPCFLAAWTSYIDTLDDFGIFGGQIEPIFEVAPPNWLLRSRLHFSLMFSERNLPEGPAHPYTIFGCNMAVRTAIFRQGFRFDEDIGPNAQDPWYPMGGETEFCARVARSGVECWFAKEPRVQHIVRADQLTEISWANRAYRCGRGRAHQMWKRGERLMPPRPSWVDRLAILPTPKHRFRRLSAKQLARGFHDECIRRGTGTP
jgi:glycosyltransferase involved in cell wall biosynthesis